VMAACADPAHDPNLRPRPIVLPLILPRHQGISFGLPRHHEQGRLK